MLKPDREDFDKWIGSLPDELKPLDDSEYGKMLSAYRAGVIATEQRHTAPAYENHEDRGAIQRAIAFLIVLESNAYAKDENVLAHYVRETIISLDNLINPE